MSTGLPSSVSSEITLTKNERTGRCRILTAGVELQVDSRSGAEKDKLSRTDCSSLGVPQSQEAILETI